MNSTTVDASRNDRVAHRSFLNAYYGATRHFYDLTRRYYLFGRDATIDELLCQPWSRLVEVGSGTGRNLRALARRRPAAEYGALDASDVMLAHLQRRLPRAKTAHGFAEDADLAGLLSDRPERVLFSYCLSMVGDPEAALMNAKTSLAPGGKVVVVDFADLSAAPAGLGKLFHDQWLLPFHVTPLSEALLRDVGAELTYGPMRYWVRAEIPSG